MNVPNYCYGHTIVSVGGHLRTTYDPGHHPKYAWGMAVKAHPNAREYKHLGYEDTPEAAMAEMADGRKVEWRHVDPRTSTVTPVVHNVPGEL